MIYIGLDDTDNQQSIGTGRLARIIAEQLAVSYVLAGVTRHQLLVDDRVPYTSHNSSAVIHLHHFVNFDPQGLFNQVRALMLENFQVGSDPGLCIAWDRIPQDVVTYGQKAQSDLVTQAEARQLAAENHILLEGLGGTEDGLIGALAGVGLAATGEDGRYLLLGKIRSVAGLLSIEDVLAAGINSVKTLDGTPVSDGKLLADKLRPARRGGQAVQFVEWSDSFWTPLKL
jgi:tRNA(Ile2) C34 agmatinyltransferase TiaS